MLFLSAVARPLGAGPELEPSTVALEHPELCAHSGRLMARAFPLLLQLSCLLQSEQVWIQLKPSEAARCPPSNVCLGLGDSPELLRAPHHSLTRSRQANSGDTGVSSLSAAGPEHCAGEAATIVFSAALQVAPTWEQILRAAQTCTQRCCSGLPLTH